MKSAPTRQSIDLSAFPDLVMVLLGFQARKFRSLPALVGIGRGLSAIQRNPPDGLLGHSQFLYAWNHIGIKQYWRDLESLEQFTHSAPHANWWRDFLKDDQGSGFWHEAYSAKGGIEAIYISMPKPPGLATFAPSLEPTGPFMSSRDRLQKSRHP